MVGKLTKNWRASCSLIAQIMELSPWGTRVDALHRCIQAKTGVLPDHEQNRFQRLGDVLEPVILAEAANLLGLIKWNFYIDESWNHKVLPLSGSADGIAYVGDEDIVLCTDPDKGIFTPNDEYVYLRAGSAVVLEAKATSNFPETELPAWRGAIQVQGLMECHNPPCSYGCVAVLYQSTDLRLFIFERDPKFLELIADIIPDFNRRVQEEDYYAPFSSKDCNTIWSQALDEAVEVDGTAEQAGRDILAAKQKIKECKEIIDSNETVIKSQMGSNQYGKVGNLIYTWKTRTYRKQPEKIIEAKPQRIIRQSNITIKEVKDD